jgi:hypothetical protein
VRFIASIIYFISGIIEFFLALRILLDFFRLDSSYIVTWINSITNPIISPFTGLVPSPVLLGNFALNTTALIALAFYALLFSLILSIFRRPY